MNNIIKLIYERLLSYYGPQHWWPGDGLEIAVGAVLTQQASWSNVEKALTRLKKANCLSINCLYNIKLKELEELIKPSGFYRIKAQRLKNLIVLLKNNPEPSREELLKVKGLGFETVDSILNYMFEKPIFVVDAYTFRIMRRLGIYTEEKNDYIKMQSLISSNIPKDAKLYQEFHALIVRHAKESCKKNKPLCSSCPLLDICSQDLSDVEQHKLKTKKRN